MISGPFLTIRDSTLCNWGTQPGSLRSHNGDWSHITNSQRRVFLEIAKAIHQGRVNDVLTHCEGIENNREGIVGVGYAKMLALQQLGRNNDALDALTRELTLHPEYHEARTAWNNWQGHENKRLPPLINAEQRFLMMHAETIQRGFDADTSDSCDLTLIKRVIQNQCPKHIVFLGFNIADQTSDLERYQDLKGSSTCQLEWIPSEQTGSWEPSTNSDAMGAPRLILVDLTTDTENTQPLLSAIQGQMNLGEYLGLRIRRAASSPLQVQRHLQYVQNLIFDSPGEYVLDNLLLDHAGFDSFVSNFVFLRRSPFKVNHTLPLNIIRDFMCDDPIQWDIETRMSQNERFSVYFAAHTQIDWARPGTILEIGSWAGGSLKLLMDPAIRSSSTAKAISIEPVPQPDFPLVVKYFAGRITHIPCDSANAFSSVCDVLDGEHLNLLLVDGDHSYRWVRHDLENYVPLVAPGGLILVHDYFDEGTIVESDEMYFRSGAVPWGVREACREILEERYACTMVPLPQLYPESCQQSRSELPPVSPNSNTIRCYRKPYK